MGFLGCCGAFQESQCMLATFFALVLVLFAGQIAAGIWLKTNEQRFTELAKKSLAKSIQQEYGVNALMSGIIKGYDKIHEEGIKSYAGSGKNQNAKLDWEMSLPNFWNFKFQADEALYSYHHLKRDQIIRDKINEMRTLYSNMMDPEFQLNTYHKMMVFEHDPNW